jgi:hypothetical protein
MKKASTTFTNPTTMIGISGWACRLSPPKLRGENRKWQQQTQGEAQGKPSVKGADRDAERDQGD